MSFKFVYTCIVEVAKVIKTAKQYFIHIFFFLFFATLSILRKYNNRTNDWNNEYKKAIRYFLITSTWHSFIYQVCYFLHYSLSLKDFENNQTIKIYIFNVLKLLLQNYIYTKLFCNPRGNSLNYNTSGYNFFALHLFVRNNFLSLYSFIFQRFCFNINI